jgi:hypothetical protein
MNTKQKKNSTPKQSKKSKKIKTFYKSVSQYKLVIISGLVMLVASVFAYNMSTFMKLSQTDLFEKVFKSKASNNQTINEKVQTSNNMKSDDSIYKFSARDINGKIVDFQKYKGRVVFIVK